MCLAVGFNNAPSIDSLPRSVANCTTVNLSSLDPVWLKRSTNIFCGIFIGLTAICVIYQIIVIALKLLNVHFIQDHHKYFYWMVSLTFVGASGCSLCLGVAISQQGACHGISSSRLEFSQIDRHSIMFSPNNPL